MQVNNHSQVNSPAIGAKSDPKTLRIEIQEKIKAAEAQYDRSGKKQIASLISAFAGMAVPIVMLTAGFLLRTNWLMEAAAGVAFTAVPVGMGGLIIFDMRMGDAEGQIKSLEKELKQLPQE